MEKISCVRLPCAYFFDNDCGDSLRFSTTGSGQYFIGDEEDLGISETKIFLPKPLGKVIENYLQSCVKEDGE